MRIHYLLKAILYIFSINTPLAFASPILWIDDWQGRIGKVDVATGSASVLGNSGVGLTDIAFNPTGNLYGVSFNSLYNINTTSGAASLIGSLGVGDVNGLVFSSTGTLYASAISGELYSVNTSTGAATGLFNTGFASGGDLAFNGSSLFYTDASNLISINLLNNTVSLIGAIGASPFYGLATGDNGTLYAVANNSIYSVNTSTGAGTFVSTYGNGLGSANGTAFFSEAGATNVPEPSTLFLIGLGLAGLGYGKRR